MRFIYIAALCIICGMMLCKDRNKIALSAKVARHEYVYLLLFPSSYLVKIILGISTELCYIMYHILSIACCGRGRCHGN